MMREKLFLLLFCVIGSAVFAQTKSIDLPWSNTAKISKTNPKNSGITPIGQSLNLRWNQTGPQFTQRWADRAPVKNSGFKIRNIVWGTPNEQDTKKLSGVALPETLEVSLAASKARGQWYTSIEFNPFIRDNGRLRKIQSFKLDYSYDAQRSNTRVPGIFSSVLSQGNWYKFEVDQSGIYKIDRAFLSSQGMNVTSINPDLIKIYGHGGKPIPLSNSAPQYFDLPQVPIKVVGAEDGSFDPGDYILFYAQGVMGYDAENDSHFNPYA